MSQDTKTLLEWSNKYLFQNYGRAPLCLVRGEARGSGTPTARSTSTSSAGSPWTRSGTRTPRSWARSGSRQPRSSRCRTSTRSRRRSTWRSSSIDHSFGDRALLLQLRHGGQRGGDQARAEVREGDARHRRGRHHHHARRLPRPDARRALGDAQREVPARLRAAGARLQVRRVRRREGGRARGRTTGPRPSWSSRSRARAGSTSRPTATWPCSAGSCDETGALLDLRRDPDGHGPDRAPLGLPALGRGARRDDARQGARERNPDRRDGGARDVRPRDDAPGPTARRSGEPVSPRRSASRPSPRCSRTSSRSAPTGWERT